jgi:hypothetical protein
MARSWLLPSKLSLILSVEFRRLTTPSGRKPQIPGGSRSLPSRFGRYTVRARRTNCHRGVPTHRSLPLRRTNSQRRTQSLHRRGSWWAVPVGRFRPRCRRDPYHNSRTTCLVLARNNRFRMRQEGPRRADGRLDRRRRPSLVGNPTSDGRPLRRPHPQAGHRRKLNSLARR